MANWFGVANAYTASMRTPPVATYPASPPLLAMIFSPDATPSITNTRQLGLAPAKDSVLMPEAAFPLARAAAFLAAAATSEPWVLMITLVRLPHPANAPLPISDTLVSVIVSRLEHPAKAFSPIAVTVSGMLTLTRFASPFSALSGITVFSIPLRSMFSNPSKFSRMVVNVSSDISPSSFTSVMSATSSVAMAFKSSLVSVAPFTGTTATSTATLA